MEPTNLFEAKKGECIFCKIINKELPAPLVFEDEISLAFLDHRPLLKGHCLLVPQKHYETLLDLPADIMGPLFANVQILAQAVEKGMSADGSFIAINTRISQSVPHLHIHIVPRWKKDGLFSPKLVWIRKPYKDEAAMLEVQRAIKDAVKKVNKILK